VSNDSQGSAPVNILKSAQPKSEQKFRSQTQEANINRGKNKLTHPSTTGDFQVENSGHQQASAREGTASVKQKAVRQFLEKTLG